MEVACVLACLQCRANVRPEARVKMHTCMGRSLHAGSLHAGALLLTMTCMKNTLCCCSFFTLDIFEASKFAEEFRPLIQDFIQLLHVRPGATRAPVEAWFPSDLGLGPSACEESAVAASGFRVSSELLALPFDVLEGRGTAPDGSYDGSCKRSARRSARRSCSSLEWHANFNKAHPRIMEPLFNILRTIFFLNHRILRRSRAAGLESMSSTLRR
eukprot:364397-Chlamydomonas_euryale.AAC.23